MKPPMLHTAYKVSSTRNAYGDYIAGAETEIKCHFRQINEIQEQGNRQQIQSDAMMWTEPDAPIAKGDIIKFDGEHYRVEELTHARRLRHPAVQFLKMTLTKYGVIS